jgi:NitT/TauT family transport system substrate-binding protein
VSESTILAILKSFNIAPSDVKMVAIGDFGAGLTALEHDKVDVAIIPEPIYSRKMKEGVKYKILPWLASRIPAYTQTVGIATEEAIAKQTPKLRAVVEARRKGVEYLYAHPKEAAQILAKAYNLPPDIAESAVSNTLSQNPTWWNEGELKQPLMEAMADALASVGALQLPIDWQAAVDGRFVPRAKTQ